MTMPLPNEPLSDEQIEELRNYDTPTVSNALELLNPNWDRNSGLMAPCIRALFPEKRPLVGYASTFLFETRQPARSRKLYVEWPDYWRYVRSVPAPRVSVGQDLDAPDSTGSMWGEVQANIHLALNCAGVILEGAVRDLDPMREMDYPCFATEIRVGHGYAHLVDVGHPVEVGGVLVHSGDLIHADLHGMLVIPHQYGSRLADTCRWIVEMERPLIAVCKDSENFTLDRLIAAYGQFTQEYPEDAPPAI